MEKIIIRKRNSNIRKEGKMVRISSYVDEQLNRISQESGISKTYLADYLLSCAIEAVEIREE